MLSALIIIIGDLYLQNSFHTLDCKSSVYQNLFLKSLCISNRKRPDDSVINQSVPIKRVASAFFSSVSDLHHRKWS